jgi:serine/threonine protein kinase
VYQPGHVLDGKYEVLEPLATGGMGTVYLVRHRHLEELRVVKVLRQDVAADPAAHKRFLREARLATQVKHANVAILYDYSQLPEGAFYMVWEHVKGREVGECLRAEGPFALATALDLGIQGLRGLGAIHATGVIHRDVSPDNLMITEDRRGRPLLKIIDLGLAKTLQPEPDFEITQTGTFMGKLRYCSPEQAEPGRGEALDNRSDLYSFGLVLYEMICGRSPFPDGDGPVFIFQRLKEDPLPLTGRNSAIEVPQEVSRVVLKALARKREERYSDAVRFIEELERVARSLDEAATRRVPVPEGAVPPRTASGGRPSTKELSPEERRRLLERIDRAAERARETTESASRVDLALDAGRLDDAARLLAELEEAAPLARNLPALKRKLAKALASHDRTARVGEIEKMLNRYLKARQLRLAELAYDSLLEVAPAHPRKSDFNAWIELLRGELVQDERLERELASGREALGRADFKVAHKRLEAARKVDGEAEAVLAFAREVEGAEAAHKKSAGLDQTRQRFDRLLERGQLDQAQAELAGMGALGATRVSLDLLRGRLADARRRQAEDLRAQGFERRFRQRIEAGEFQAAREVALELEAALPDHPRPAAMFAETARTEQEHRKRQAVAQGERQVETLIEQGRADQAALALKILLQLDPKNRNRRSYQRRLRSLGG